MNNLIDLVNSKLTCYVNSIPNESLKEVIKYALFPGGKRLRPLLLLCILDDLSLDVNLGINQAIAIEMIHNYSLIHDDLPSMDNDDFRRGRPTVHKQYDEAKAILAADALLTDAFYYFASGSITNKQKVEIIKLASFNSGSKGMVLGQILDISSNSNNISYEDVKEMHLHKTRDLIHLAIKSAGIIANLSDDKLSLLDELADYFGIAFQIKDDIDDFNEEGSDLKNNKATYPSVIGVEKSIQLLNDYKTKSLKICNNIFGERSLYRLIERIL